MVRISLEIRYSSTSAVSCMLLLLPNLGSYLLINGGFQRTNSLKSWIQLVMARVDYESAEHPYFLAARCSVDVYKICTIQPKNTLHMLYTHVENIRSITLKSVYLSRHTIPRSRFQWLHCKKQIERYYSHECHTTVSTFAWWGLRLIRKAHYNCEAHQLPHISESEGSSTIADCSVAHCGAACLDCWKWCLLFHECIYVDLKACLHQRSISDFE
jgi:hypothetical protein